MSSIKLSPKHGVNPSMEVCFYCGEDDGTVMLPGRLPDDAEAPRRGVWTKEPCEKCKGLMAQGVMLISVRDGETDVDNPYRTGKVAVVTNEGIRRMVNPASLAEQIIAKRVAFVPDEAWKKLGLPV